MATTYPVRRVKPKPGDYVHLNGGERYVVISEMGALTPIKHEFGHTLPLRDNFGNSVGKFVRVGFHLQSHETGHVTSIRAKSLMIDGNIFEEIQDESIPLF